LCCLAEQKVGVKQKKKRVGRGNTWEMRCSVVLGAKKSKLTKKSPGPPHPQTWTCFPSKPGLEGGLLNKLRGGLGNEKPINKGEKKKPRGEKNG